MPASLWPLSHSEMCIRDRSNAVLAKAALPQAEIAVDAALTLSPDPNDKRRALASLAGVQVEILHKESVQ